MKLLAVGNPRARAFYEAEALRGGWTSRQLDRQIQTQFYERTALSRDKAAMLRKGGEAKAGDAVTPEEEIKDPYVLEFLDLKDEYSESDLEDGLVSRLETSSSSSEMTSRSSRGSGACGSTMSGTGSISSSSTEGYAA